MKTCCFKCHQAKPLTEYYKHPQMGDGHLNKCKSCARKDVADRVEEKGKTDLAWVLSERERHRIKSERQRREGTAQKPMNSHQKEWRAKNPLKRAAHLLLASAIDRGSIQRKPCIECGETKAQAHHEDYTKPLDVIWLCPKHHSAHHVRIRDTEIAKKFAEAS